MKLSRAVKPTLPQTPGAPVDGAHFDYWWDREGMWVEPPNERRGGLSGVRLLVPERRERPVLYCKRQIGHLHRSFRHPLGRPTILREREALEAVRKLGVRVPQIVYCASRKVAGNWQALLVTEALEGFVSLLDWYENCFHQRDRGQGHLKMLTQLAGTLARLHRAGWQHGCCYPKHVFIRVSGDADEETADVALLDLEKSRRRWQPAAASEHDLGQLSRHRGKMPEDDWEWFQRAYRLALGEPTECPA